VSRKSTDQPNQTPESTPVDEQGPSYGKMAVDGDGRPVSDPKNDADAIAGYVNTDTGETTMKSDKKSTKPAAKSTKPAAKK